MSTVSTQRSDAPLRQSASAFVSRLMRKRAEVAVLACASIVYFFAYFHRVAIPGTIFDELQAAFTASAGAITALGAIYVYIYGGMQLFAGVMNDRLGALRVLWLGALLLALGSLAFPLATSLPMLYAARALVGLGSSLIYISIVKALDTLFASKHFPALLGIIMSIGLAGGLVGTAPFERAVHLWSWRPVLLAIGVLGLLAFVLYAALARGPRQHDTPASVPASLIPRAVLRNRLSLPMLIAWPINFAVYFLLQATLGKKFLLDYAGLNSAIGASFTFLMMLVSMGGVLTGGFLTRAIGNRRKPIALFAVGCTLTGAGLLLGCVLAGVRGWPLLAGFLLLGLSNISSPVANAIMREINPAGAIGAAIGLLNGACYLAVAILTSVAGAMLDRFRAAAVTTATAVIYPRDAYLTVLILCFALMLIAFTSACFVRETFGEPIYRE